MNLTISYSPVSFGSFRLSATMKRSFIQLKTMGISEQDVEHVRDV
jgi:hypothetical protein